MKKSLLTLKVAGALFLALPALSASAQFEKVRTLPGAYGAFATSEGNLLVSSWDSTLGGIYLSTDKGAKWKKRSVKNHDYCDFFEFDGYLFATGYGCHIARSEDGGQTWDVLNYSAPMREHFDAANMEATACYTMVEHDGKIYAGDFLGLVMYTEDYGETWTSLDLDSRTVPIDMLGDGNVEYLLDCIYSLASYKGDLYSFGLYAIHRYNAETGLWEQLPMRSNNMATNCVVDDTFVCGRCLDNYNPETPYLFATTDFEDWSFLPHPEGIDYTNVRALIYDGKNLFSFMPFLGAFCTSDLGQTWHHISGCEYSLWPCTSSMDDDYIYVAMYTPSSDEKNGGLWRIPRDADFSSVRPVIKEISLPVRISDDCISVDAPDAVIAVFNAIGRLVPVRMIDGKADISRLLPGVYVYDIATKEGHTSAKFIKK